MQLPKKIIAAHQTAARTATANKAINLSVADHVNVRNYQLESDAIRYTIGSISIKYAADDSLDKYGDLKLFFKEYAKEPLIKPFMTSTDMKKVHPRQVFDLRFQVYQIKPNKKSTVWRK